MDPCPDQERETAWLQAVRAFCQERGLASLQVSQPARKILVQWPIADQPALIEVTVFADWGLLFLLPLGTISPDDRQAALMAAGALNYRLVMACMELDPLSGDARVRVTVAVSDQPSAKLIERAFGALEVALAGFVQGLAAFKALSQAIQAQDEGPLTSNSPEALAHLWNGRPITD